VRESGGRVSYGQARGCPIRQLVQVYSRGFASSLGWADVQLPLIVAAGAWLTAGLSGEPRLTSLLRMPWAHAW